MAKRQEVEFVIRPDGSVEEKVIGVSGPQCEAITDSIETALGTVAHREHTSNYYQESDASGEMVTTRG